jgi:hypothetical protein
MTFDPRHMSRTLVDGADRAAARSPPSSSVRLMCRGSNVMPSLLARSPPALDAGRPGT